MKQRPSDWERYDEDGLREAGVAFDALPDGRSGCVPIEMLRAARAAALPEDAHAKVATHLASCAFCRQLDADLEAADLPDMTLIEGERIFARVQNPASAEKAQGARVGWRFSWRPAVATLAFAAVALLVVQVANRLGPLAPTQGPAVAGPPRPVASVFDLQKPPVKLSVNVLTLRGAAGKKQEYLKDLAPALDAYRADDYALAAKRFGALTAKYPRATEVLLYLGVSRLFLKDHSGAVEVLRVARQSTDHSLSPDIAWYYALALQRLGRFEDVRSVLVPLCAGKSEYAARACAGLQELNLAPAAGTAR